MKSFFFGLLLFPYSLFSITINHVQQPFPGSVAGSLFPVVTNPSGQAIALWVFNDLPVVGAIPNKGIYYNYFDPTVGSWSVSLPLRPTNFFFPPPNNPIFGVPGRDPAVGIDNNGNAIAIWVNPTTNLNTVNNTFGTIAIAYFDWATKTWNNYMQLEPRVFNLPRINNINRITNSPASNAFPRIAINGAGDAIATWTSDLNTVIRVFVTLTGTNVWTEVLKGTPPQPLSSNGFNPYPVLANRKTTSGVVNITGSVTWQDPGLGRIVSEIINFTP